MIDDDDDDDDDDDNDDDDDDDGDYRQDPTARTQLGSFSEENENNLNLKGLNRKKVEETSSSRFSKSAKKEIRKKF